MRDEFLGLIEELRSEEASIHRLFNGEGEGVRQGRAARKAKDPAYAEHLSEAVVFIGEVMSGKRPAHHLQEAMTTSDFPLLFGDVIDRMLLANYREAPAVYRNFCKISQVRDFRTVKRFAVDGAEGVLDQVAQQAPYPEGSLAEASYSYAVAKYGRRLPFAWEVLINDDLSSFTDVLQRLGRAARRTEQKFATQLYVDANGPHASLYTAGNKNIVSAANGASATNPALSISGLQDAFLVLGAMRDADGEPIVVDVVHLVVPPALEIVANNILNATELILGGQGQTGGGGVAAQALRVANWMRTRTKLSVDPYIPVVATTNGNTSWFLFADPGDSRPALEIGFLRGHEEPETFIKSPNALRAGGGEDPQNGDFDTDSIDYKVRHVLGGSRISGKATVGSNGSGS